MKSTRESNKRTEEINAQTEEIRKETAEIFEKINSPKSESRRNIIFSDQYPGGRSIGNY